MMSEHWPRGTLVTRLYERDSLALSLIRSSGETRAHRSPSARPAFLTVRRLLYSNGFLPPFSSAEFCSAYLTLEASHQRDHADNRQQDQHCAKNLVLVHNHTLRLISLRQDGCPHATILVHRVFIDIKVFVELHHVKLDA